MCDFTEKLIFTHLVKEFSVWYLTGKRVYCIVDKNLVADIAGGKEAEGV